MMCKKNKDHEVDSLGCIDCFYNEIIRRWSSVDLVENKRVDLAT